MKIIKYEFTNPLQRHENITSACGIQFSIKAYVIHRENRFLKWQKEAKNTVKSSPILMSGVLKLLNMNLHSHCNATKTLPVDAEFNSLSNHMSCIERIDF